MREWALRILSATSLDEKLLDPGPLTDSEKGPPLLFKEPCRPTGMHFQPHSRKDKIPGFHEHHIADKRAICLHRFAGHELLAVEIMAQVLLAFPDAPTHFRKGVANTLREEQGHVKIYMQRMQELGLRFGDLPLYRHFWACTPHLTSPLHYVSMMSLTFEMANLDFAPLYGKSFAQAGDEASAALMQQILHDEIAHVSFGWNWLKKLKNEDDSTWDAWEKSLPPTILPCRAKGHIYHEEHRRKAGLPEEWIEKLKACRAKDYVVAGCAAK